MTLGIALTSMVNPIVRAVRANLAGRDNWAQIRVGACALLLPPLTLGAAFYSMLAAPEQGAGRPPGIAARNQVVRPVVLRDMTPPRPVGADPQPAARAIRPIANPLQPAPPRGISASARDGRQQPSSAPAEDMAPLDLAPAQVTGAPVGTWEGSPPGARVVEPPWPATAQASTALLPRALVLPGKTSSHPLPPQMTAQRPAAHAPSAAAPPSSGRAGAAPRWARKHARSETAAGRRSAQPSEHAFSLKDWLQQLGVVARNTGG